MRTKSYKSFFVEFLYGDTQYIHKWIVVMGLNIPREPVEIKEFIRVVRIRLGGDVNIEGIDYDSLAVWAFNRLPKYLWGEWRDELKQRGVTWQLFLRILRMHTLDMIEWALKGSMLWSELVRRIVKSIDRYSALSSGK